MQMEDPDFSAGPAPANSAARAALLYACFASAWILGSDQVVALMTQDPDRLILLQTLKGWLFVSVTALLLYVLVRRAMQKVSVSDAAVRSGLEEYRRLLEASPHPMWIVDPEQLRFLAVNEAALEHYGFSRAQFMAMPLTDVAASDGLLPLLGPTAAAGGGAPGKGAPAIHRHRDGYPMHVETAVREVTFEGQRAALMLINDVTDRHRAEEALRLSRDHLQSQQSALIDLVRSGLLAGDDAGKSIRYLTEVSARTVGVERSSVWLFDDQRSAIRSLDLYQVTSAEHSAGAELHTEQFPHYFHALAQEEAVVADDAHSHPATAEFSETYLMPNGIASMLDVPIHVEGGLAGVLCLEHVGAPLSWTPEQQFFAIAVANLVALVIEQGKRRQAQDNLARSERTFRALVEHAPDAIVVFDADEGRFVDANPNAEWLFGLPRDVLLKTDPIALSPPVQPDGTSSAESGSKWIEAALAGEVPTFEWLHRDANGTDVLCEVKLLRFPGGDRRLIRGSILDITERKRAERALRDSEARFRALIESLPTVFFVFDERGRLRYWNSRAEQASGYTGTEIAQMRVLDFISAKDKKTVARRISEAFSGGEAEIEASLRTRGGKELPFYLIGRKVTLDGEPCVVGNGLDISTRKRAEEQINQINVLLEKRVSERTAELAAANRELESFSYSVSHDLRAPLRAIDGYSAILAGEHGAALDDQARELLSRVRRAVQRMGELIDDLLELSRLSRREIVWRDVDLSEMARHIVADLRERDQARQVDVTIASDLHAQGDPSLLRVALDNLIGNAWKFTSKSAAARIELGTAQQNERRAYFVRDNGAGFDMRYVGKLFGAFQRLHTDRDFAGSGIGLATVQRIIHRHGGQVWAEGVSGEGATFYFTLGTAPAPDGERGEKQRAAA